MVYQVIEVIVNFVAVEETVDSLIRILNTGIDDLKSNLKDKILELLKPHYQGHPLTYNHYLTETVQKIQAKRQKARIEEALKQSFGLDEISDFVTRAPRSVDLVGLVGT